MRLALLSNRKLWIVPKVKIPGIEWLLGNRPLMDKTYKQN